MSGIAAIVLAAGGSSRLGQPKQLVKYEGQSLLRRATCAVIDAGCLPTIVVLGARHSEMLTELDGLHVHIALNSEWERGIGSSIRCGMNRLIELDAKVDGVLISLCDQPMVTNEALVRLIKNFSPEGKPICVTAFGNAIGPPVIASQKFFPDLLKLRDDQGAKAIWLSQPQVVHRVQCDAAAIDVDTIDDFRRLTGTP